MTKWACPCGETVQSSGGIPHPTELLAIAAASLTDDEWESGLVLTQFLERSVSIFPCASCSRLHVLWNGFGGEVTVYAPELVIDDDGRRPFGG